MRRVPTHTHTLSVQTAATMVEGNSNFWKKRIFTRLDVFFCLWFLVLPDHNCNMIFVKKKKKIIIKEKTKLENIEKYKDENKKTLHDSELTLVFISSII